MAKRSNSSSRNTTRTATTMMVERYLAIGPSGSTRIGTTPMALKPNEVCIALRIELPLELFKQPVLKAQIVVPAGAGSRKPLDVKMQTSIADVVKQATGLEITLVPAK
jgi:hypothetical protein